MSLTWSRRGNWCGWPTRVSATLEVAEIQRRVYAAVGLPSCSRTCRVAVSPWSRICSGPRTSTLSCFAHTLPHVRQLIELKSDPQQFWRQPFASLRALPTAAHMRPRRRSDGPVLAESLTIDQLPQLKSWPDDGGAFITLPQVYTEDVERPGLHDRTWACIACSCRAAVCSELRSRAALSAPPRDRRPPCCRPCSAASRCGSIFLSGGTPAMTLGRRDAAARRHVRTDVRRRVGRHRIPMVCRPGQLPIYARGRFLHPGPLDPQRLLPEGPFGDTGLLQPGTRFPVLRVEQCHLSPGRDLAVHGRGAAAAGRHRLRAS